MIQHTVPYALRDASLADLLPSIREMFESVDVHTLARKGGLVLIYGPEGAGKTHVAAALMNHIAASRWMFTWVDVIQWPTTFVTMNDEVADLSGTTCPAVIDDLGREPKHTSSGLLNAVLRLATSPRLLVVTTNIAIDTENADNCQLTRTYGRAMRSRFLAGTTIYLDGADRRLED